MLATTTSEVNMDSGIREKEIDRVVTGKLAHKIVEVV
jgi:hypothetical protein